MKLAALVDKNRHPHPPGVHHIYKLILLCELTGGEPRTSAETDAVEFFPVTALPELSTHRILAPRSSGSTATGRNRRCRPTSTDP